LELAHPLGGRRRRQVELGREVGPGQAAAGREQPDYFTVHLIHFPYYTKATTPFYLVFLGAMLPPCRMCSSSRSRWRATGTSPPPTSATRCTSGWSSKSTARSSPASSPATSWRAR